MVRNSIALPLLVGVCLLLAARSASAQSTLFRLENDVADSFFGFSAAGAGDVNDDGFDDIVVGAADGTLPGFARVYSGADGTVLHQMLSR